MRRRWVPQPNGLGNQAPTMDDAPQIVPHLAPEGRYVYRTCDTPQMYMGSKRAWKPSPYGYWYDLAPEGRHVYSTHMRHPKAPDSLNRGLHGLKDYTEGGSVLPLAPEGRHVYSTRHTPNTLKPQRGDRYSLSESRITRIKGLHGRRERLPLAPEGRHVYSTRHAPNTLKPQRGDRYSLSESRITRIKGLHGRRERLPLAPEGRHVYSTRHTPNT